MNRRAFVTGLGAVLAAPVAAEAQSGARFIASAIFHHRQLSSSPFRHGLRELGYIEGQNLAIEARLAAGKIDRLPALAAELIRARVDVIAAVSPPAIEAAKRATTAIPIVMAFISVDPVRSGFVDSLSRPGGNITGVAMIADDIAGKRLALLKEMVPTATRIALLAQVNHSSSVSQAKAARETAKALGVELQIVEARDSRDYDAALGAITKTTPGVFILANPTFFDDRERLAAVAVRHRLATLCEWGQMAEAGCLMSYGPNISDLYRRVGIYVDKILKGAKPADLPVEQPTKFELVINLKTARALGLTIPPSLLLRAHQVVE
jgi:putative tryptophan/tyrosine transport system substrate-binding protein